MENPIRLQMWSSIGQDAILFQTLSSIKEKSLH